MGNPNNRTEWFHLKSKKEVSRLLYTNPVCLLCTRNTGDPEEESSSSSPTTTSGEANVMVISWLTATNNEGDFIMSINKRRHTARNLSCSATSTEFTLSIPVKSMEDIVLNIGSTSGRVSSKFGSCENDAMTTQDQEPNPSKMSKRQWKRQRFLNGIPGLLPTKLGQSASSHATTGDTPTFPFAIQGTVAHLRCTTIKVLEDIIDEQHLLVTAKVIEAFCDPRYWDSEKNLFLPVALAQPAPAPPKTPRRTSRSDNSPGDDEGEPPQPHLKFFGAQTFGYVVP